MGMLANYSLDIFKRANIKFNNYVLSVLVQSSTLLGYVISACIMNNIKRKNLFLFSAALMGIFQAILGSTLKAMVRDVIYYLVHHSKVHKVIWQSTEK